MTECARWADHESSVPEAKRGGCRHKKAEEMSRAAFGRLPVVRCSKCREPLGRICPECHHYY
jgi:hypothetical protein